MKVLRERLIRRLIGDTTLRRFADHAMVADCDELLNELGEKRHTIRTLTTDLAATRAANQCIETELAVETMIVLHLALRTGLTDHDIARLRAQYTELEDAS